MNKTKPIILSILALTLMSCSNLSSDYSKPSVPSASVNNSTLSIEAPSEVPTEKPTGKPTERPAETPTEKPTGEKKSEKPSVSLKKGDGTVSAPYSCKDALAIAEKLADKTPTSQSYYIYGTIRSISEVSTSYGNATFTITSEDTDLIFFRGYFLNKAKFTSSDQVKVGDSLVIYGTIQRFNGALETGSKAYIYSIEKNDKPSEDKPGKDSQTSHPSVSVDATGYYSSLPSNLTGGRNGTLRTELTKLIQPKAYYVYGGKGESTLSNLLQSADEDPNNKNNRIYFYTRKSVEKNPANGWNREHVWPQSLSGGLYGTSGGGCDILHIRPTYETTNSKRGNHKFANCPNGTEAVYNGVTYGKLANGCFEPQDSVKGDVARICFYRWTCYFATRNTPLTNVTDSVATLLSWNKLDPVDDLELNRNEVAQGSKQKNRNPFVDHPEWVDRIFDS